MRRPYACCTVGGSRWRRTCAGFRWIDLNRLASARSTRAGVTGQNIPSARIYPGLKQPKLYYTRVYYGLGQFIFPQANYTLIISTTIAIIGLVLSDILMIYLFFQQVIEDSVLSGKLSEKAK